MKIAVCSKDFQQVSGHAGQAKRWLVYETDTDHAPRLVDRIELKKEQTFHHFKDDAPHPLDDITALLTSSSGDSFLRRMRKRGVDAVLTGETDPVAAVNDYIAQNLKPAKPRPIMGLICKVRDRFSDHRDVD